MSEYNGWKNWETWNVALWISNDEGLCSMAKESGSYAMFRDSIREISEDTGSTSGIGYETPDGAAWNDSGLDLEALEEMVSEL